MTLVATVSARFTGELVSLKMSNGSANPVKELPKLEIVCPVQNFQKSLLDFWIEAVVFIGRDVIIKELSQRNKYTVHLYKHNILKAYLLMRNIC